ncbi:hypothetical protein Patl1_31745 [Pistacia atlantica]|uniref:Uncharacterized protein n=1 Tax=Pistacia atlantica TaxID=434234 RepID=A0ACC1ARX9_9ROSI|nr:hypothetical protein Patl1_31745 [Pistacia atlantica]
MMATTATQSPEVTSACAFQTPRTVAHATLSSTQRQLGPTMSTVLPAFPMPPFRGGYLQFLHHLIVQWRLKVNHESGIAIQLGCSCKDDLAVAHKQCAEAWFKIRGNKNLYVTLPGSLSFCESRDLPPDWMTCEICNSIARNVAGATEMEAIEQSNETNSATAMSSVSASAHHGENRNFWHGHRFLNFLLACMVFAFVISWLFPL